VNCRACGKLLSTYYSKKVDYNYIQCHNPDCHAVHEREDVYLEQIGSVLKGLKVTQEAMDDLTKALAESHETEQ